MPPAGGGDGGDLAGLGAGMTNRTSFELPLRMVNMTAWVNIWGSYMQRARADVTKWDNKSTRLENEFSLPDRCVRIGLGPLFECGV